MNKPAVEDDQIGIDRATLTACLHRISLGDGAAREDRYRRTSAKLFSICTRILSERAEAEDVLQEITVANVNQSNGVIQVVNKVLMP
jgi:hypothetical protein